jgi:WD40 repeat protein/tRNA A-37 threonylcarbamoyl transferase component Bud32
MKEKRQHAKGQMTMDAEQIFHKAVDIADPKDRAAYLDRVCRDDDELRDEVEALLHADEKAVDFLESPAVNVDATSGTSTLIEGPGTKIGRYELLEQIGEGGMGLVYMAEQKEPVKRRVALKIIKPGMDTKEVIARFEAERQTLALLDHPNIAHVLDAGTTDKGLPYFVMEYVRGMSITRYCDERRLDIERRLRLFREVCEGVHHAHQKGIIHRDIKPSNILISMHGDRAVPKIIDFGIAKAAAGTLTDKTMFTLQGQLLGTPEYMSPEQVDLATQDVDTRSDIYSLGVVLYELLAGVLPFDRESLQKIGFSELQRTLREQEPASPSIRLANLGEEAKAIADSRMTQVVPLARRLHRELEWIPLKAMRKDRCRRYKSVSDMADDIQSYLNGNPLIAGPETAMYRVQKFVHKHAGSVATAALVSVAVVLGLVISIVMGCRAEQARQKEASARIQLEQALTRAEKAEKTAREQRELAEAQRELAEQRAEDYRRAMYVKNFVLAEEALGEGRSDRTQKFLGSCEPELRGWEWYRLNHISDQAIETLSVDKEGVKDVVLAHDGSRFASAGADGTMKIWDAEDRREVMAMHGQLDLIKSAAFSPDGKRMASISKKGEIKIWDARFGRELMTLKDEGPSKLMKLLDGSSMKIKHIGPIAFSPDGKRIVCGIPNFAFKAWDVSSGAELMTFSGHENFLSSLAFSPDSKRIVSSSIDDTIRVWDSNTGAQLRTLEYKGWICEVAISPDGKRIASVNAAGTAKLWDTETGAELMVLYGHHKMARCVTFSSDGARIATGGGAGEIKVWDATNGSELATLLGHGGPVTGLVFSQDDKHIISGSLDGTVKVWEPGVAHTTAATLDVLCHTMAFSDDGKRIITGGYQDPSIRIWDAVTGEEVMKLEGGRGYGRFSPDGKHIASVDGNDICVWDASDGRKLKTLSGHESGPLTGQQPDIWTLSYSPDGTRIASGGMDRTVRMWNVVTGAEIMTLRGHGERSYYPEFSPVCSVAFSPDGQLIASGSYDGTARIWDAGTGAEISTLQEHSWLVNAVAFSPDGKRLASASSDETVRVWDVATGNELQVLEGHDDEVISVAFSPDGKRIASGSKDKTVRIWDAATGLAICKFSIEKNVWELCFSPDGKTLATTSSPGLWTNCTVTLWESSSPVE